MVWFPFCIAPLARQPSALRRVTEFDSMAQISSHLLPTTLLIIPLAKPFLYTNPAATVSRLASNPVNVHI